MRVPVYFVRLAWSVVINEVAKASLVSVDLKPAEKPFGLSLKDIIETIPWEQVATTQEELAFHDENTPNFAWTNRIRNGHKGWLIKKIAARATAIGTAQTNMKQAFALAFRGRRSEIRSGMQQSINYHLYRVEVPLSKDHSINYWQALYICEMAKILTTNKEVIKQIENILSCIRKWEPGKNTRLSKKIGQESEWVTHKNFWSVAKNNMFPTRFFNTHFKSYENIRATLNAKHEWGIDSRYVFIGSPDRLGYCPITVTTRYDKEIIRSRGLVTFDSATNCLIAQVFRESTENWKNAGGPAFFIMKVWDAALQTLLIGHYTINSLYYNRQVSKLMIWENTSGPVEPREYSNNDVSFKEVDLNIRRLLRDPHFSRIQVPDARILNLDSEDDSERSLSKFVDSYSGRMRDGKLTAFLGSYYVCYLQEAHAGSSGFVSDEDLPLLARSIRVDSVNIFFEEESLRYRVKYQDLPDEGRHADALFSYAGFAERRYDNVRLIPEGPGELFTNVEPRNILPFMTFDLPPCSGYQAMEMYSKAIFFEGIITGVDQLTKRSFSCRALLVKTDRLPEHFDDFAFRAQRSNWTSLWEKVARYFAGT